VRYALHRRIALALLLLGICVAPVAGQTGEEGPRASASIERRAVYVGDAITYAIRVTGADSVRQPTIEGLEDADVSPAGRRESRRSTQQVVNGRVQLVQERTIAYQFQIRPRRPGAFEIPEQEVVADGQRLTTNAVNFRAAEPAESETGSLRFELDRDRFYVGETVGFTLTWTIEDARGLDQFDFRSAELPDSFEVVLPSNTARRNTHRRVAVTLFGRQTEGRVQNAPGGADYQITITGTMTASEPGRYTLDGVSLTYDRASPGGGRSRYRVSAPATEIVVESLPESGRPAGFGGLIGVYDIEADADPTSVRVGDPITLSATILGREPMRGVTDGPELAAEPAFEEAFKLSSDGWEFQPGPPGRRTFTTTIRAATDEVREIPPVPLPFFDPGSGEYRVARSEPIPINVEATREVTAADALVAAADSSPGSVQSRVSREDLEAAPPGVWAIETGPVVLSQKRFDLIESLSRPTVIAAGAAPVGVYAAAAGAAVWRRRHDPVRARQRRALARARRTLREGGPDAAIRSYLGDVFGRPAESLTVADCEALLGARGLASSQALAELLARGEAERFGGPMRVGEADAGRGGRETLRLLREADHDIRRSL